MEKICKGLAEKIGGTLKYNDEQKAVIAYGLIGLSQFLIILILSSIVGLLFGFFVESIIIFISVGLLRRTIGGAHSGNFYSCIIISVFFVAFMAAICRYFLRHIELIPLTLIIAVIYVFAILFVYKLAPVAPPNKPVRTEAKRRRLRRNAFFTLGLFSFASIILLIFSVNDQEYLKSYCTALMLSSLASLASYKSRTFFYDFSRCCFLKI